jgi:hypothetical protein
LAAAARAAGIRLTRAATPLSSDFWYHPNYPQLVVVVVPVTEFPVPDWIWIAPTLHSSVLLTVMDFMAPRWPARPI